MPDTRAQWKKTMASNGPKLVVDNSKPSPRGTGYGGSTFKGSGIGIYAQDGTEYHRGAPPPGGGGGDVSRVTLEQNVKGLNWVVGLMLAAFAGAFLFFLLRIDDRFDRVDEPMREVQVTVAAQAEALRSQSATLSDMNGTLREIDRQLHGTTIDTQTGD